MLRNFRVQRNPRLREGIMPSQSGAVRESVLRNNKRNATRFATHSIHTNIIPKNEYPIYKVVRSTVGDQNNKMQVLHIKILKKWEMLPNKLLFKNLIDKVLCFVINIVTSFQQPRNLNT